MISSFHAAVRRHLALDASAQLHSKIVTCMSLITAAVVFLLAMFPAAALPVGASQVMTVLLALSGAAALQTIAMMVFFVYCDRLQAGNKRRERAAS